MEVIVYFYHPPVREKTFTFCYQLDHLIDHSLTDHFLNISIKTMLSQN